jgi:putative hydrolase
VIAVSSKHVMDALGEQVLPSYAGLRDAMDRRRRSRSAPERVLERLLGLDFKMRQYELGKEFCDAVAAEAGTAGLNRVWASPEALPSLRELSNPVAWLERAPGPEAAAAV